jgi:hypothetical protein
VLGWWSAWSAAGHARHLERMWADTALRAGPGQLAALRVMQEHPGRSAKHTARLIGLKKNEESAVVRSQLDQTVLAIKNRNTAATTRGWLGWGLAVLVLATAGGWCWYARPWEWLRK